jgi:hypothetical protein
MSTEVKHGNETLNIGPDAKEPEYAIVAEREDEQAKRKKVPINVEDNSLGFQTLARAFPNAHGLEFKNPVTKAYHALLTDGSGTKFFPPAGGWQDKTFLVISQQPIESFSGFTEQQKQILLDLCQRESQKSSQSSRASSPVQYQQIEGDDKDAFIQRFGGYVRCIHNLSPKGKTIIGCVTVIDDHYCVTNAHVAAWVAYDEYRSLVIEPGTKRFKPGVTMEDVNLWANSKEDQLRNSFVEVYKVEDDTVVVNTQIREINFAVDFAVLYSNNGGLLDDGLAPLVCGLANKGNDYITLGLPFKNSHQEVSVLKGHISDSSTMSHPKGYILGAYGAEPGYSGGPVIRLGVDNCLLGIISGTSANNLTKRSSVDDLREAFNTLGTRAALTHIIPALNFSSHFVPHTDTDLAQKVNPDMPSTSSGQGLFSTLPYFTYRWN